MASLTLLTRNCVCTRPEPSAVVRGVTLICAQQTIRGRVSRLLSPIIVVVVVALFVLAALATLTALAALATLSALVTLAALVAVVGIGFTSLFAAILAIIVVVFASISRGARVPIAVTGLVVVLGRGTFGDVRTLVIVNLRASALSAVILWNSRAVILIGRSPIIRPIVARLSVCVTLKAIVNDVTHAPDDVLKLSRRDVSLQVRGLFEFACADEREQVCGEDREKRLHVYDADASLSVFSRSKFVAVQTREAFQLDLRLH